MEKYRLCKRLRVFVWVVLYSLPFLSCAKKQSAPAVINQPPITDTTKPKDTTVPTVTFLALGDSYTIGQSVDSSERFPAQTAALLAKDSFFVAPITYIATTGWTTTNLSNAISLQQPRGPFTIVTLLIGVNDQYQYRDTTGYRARFTSLLDSAVVYAGDNRSHVFVLSIPDYGVTPFGSGQTGVSAQIDQFNAINKSVTDSYGISYTDVTGISRAGAGDASMLANDGLHPSGKQYAQWSAVLAPAIVAALK